ncbi:MAG: RagB/SusD family nutrient uptake outer membrane protein, partial [Muribaculaceae bacterium]|nr:RagB/SusD family nutrient uptake outer membrane protein [Muribaculaceae bacterium]
MCDGTMRSVTIKMRPETKGWLPIPDDEIRKSDGMLVQNPGWGTSEGNYTTPY